MNNIPLAKKHLRKQMKAAILSLSEKEKKQESETMIARITQFINSHSSIQNVASYAATDTELNLDKLPEILPEINFCYPKCIDNGVMEFHEVSNLLDMNSMKMGIREPDKTLHKKINPEEIDLFLCPAYAYSESGERLGKGGGYYDRYLSRKRSGALTIGITFKCQKISNDKIPIEPHDFLVDYVF